MRSFTMSDESSKSLLMLLVILKMSLDFPLTQKLLNLKQLQENQNGDRISPNTLKIILICQDHLESILMSLLIMTFEDLFIVEKPLLIQIIDLEQATHMEEINQHDHLVKQILDHKQVKFLKDKKLISSQIFNSGLQCQDPAIVKNDQDVQHGKCLRLKDSKKM